MLAQIQAALHDIAQVQLRCQAMEADDAAGINATAGAASDKPGGAATTGDAVKPEPSTSGL